MLLTSKKQQGADRQKSWKNERAVSAALSLENYLLCAALTASRKSAPVVSALV